MQIRKFYKRYSLQIWNKNAQNKILVLHHTHQLGNIKVSPLGFYNYDYIMKIKWKEERI